MIQWILSIGNIMLRLSQGRAKMIFPIRDDHLAEP
jgi:hypothetical protein